MSGDAVKAAIVVGAVAALPVAAGWASGFTIGSLSPALSTFIVSAGSSLVLSTVNQKLAPDINLPDIGTSLQANTTVTVKEPTQAHRVVYGTTRIGGNIVFAETTDDQQYLHLVIAFTGHEITDFSKIYFGEDELNLTSDGTDSNGLTRFVPASGDSYNGKARIKKHLGSTTQLADADLVSEVSQWTTNHRLRGRSYLYVRLEFDSDVYPNGVPNITAEVQGKQVFDPRDSSTSLSSNPALCIRDYLTNTDYGMKADASEIDDTNFSAVANTCDESVTLDSGTENRFTLNGTFLTDQTPKNVLQNMLSSIGGHIVYSNGQFKLVAATYKTPTVTLDESNLRSGLTVNTRVSKKELFNAVKGIYSEPANKYQPQDYPVLTNATFEAEDNNERNYAEFNFPFTTSSKTCQRLSKIQLLKARQQITLVATFDLNAFELNVGDTVQITNSRMGFSNKTFEVANWNISVQSDSDGSPALVVNCELRETASEVYDFNTVDYSTVSSGKATNLASASQVTAPTAITLTDELVSYNDGTVIVKLVINLTAPSDTFSEIFEVEVRQDTDADGNAVVDDFKLIGRGARTKFEFLNVIDKAQYTVRARSVNIFGVKSTAITESRTIIGLIAPPSDVTNFACNIIGKEAHLSFDPVPDLDLAHYRINYSPLTDGAEWQNSIVLVKKLSRPGTSIVVPAKTGTYLIKAVDKLGNVSINATKVVTAVDTIGDFTDLLTQNENPDFDGAKTNVVKITQEDGTPALVLDTIELFDDNTTDNFDDITSHNFDGGTQDDNVQSSGIYEFGDTIDAGAVVTTNILATLTQQVTDRDRLFDNISGLFDDQPSNFDGDANTQSASELQIAVSNDNVTFTAFQDFTIGDYTGRYFKFRVLLTSDNNSATPIVTAVGVTLKLESFVTSQNDLSSGTGTFSVTYPKAFRLLDSIAITLSVQDMASGDKYAISNKSVNGFDIAFTNSGGTGVSRTFDYQAKGV